VFPGKARIDNVRIKHWGINLMNCSHEKVDAGITLNGTNSTVPNFI
jgi:hypothetical protein